MIRTRVESHPGTAGNNLVVVVSLGCSVLLGTALLASIGRGELFTQQNFLYVALIFYAAAAVLYLGFTIVGRESHVHFAWLATGIGLFANTLAAANRWYVAGHPPFSSMYETLLTFTLTLAALTVLVESWYGVRLVGTITMPLA